MTGQPYTIPFHPYHQNNPPTVQSPYLLYPSGTIQTLFCQSNIYNICRIIFSGGTVLSVDSTTVQPQYPQNPPKTAFNQQSVLSKKPLILTVTNDQKKVSRFYFQRCSLSRPSLFQPCDTILPLFQTLKPPNPGISATSQPRNPGRHLTAVSCPLFEIVPCLDRSVPSQSQYLTVPCPLFEIVPWHNRSMSQPLHGITATKFQQTTVPFHPCQKKAVKRRLSKNNPGGMFRTV